MSIGPNIALPGLSGYDFSGIVDMMVNNYSLPLGQMEQKKGMLETKKNAWRDINTRLSALENTLDKLRQSTTWSATSATSSNSEILNVTSAPGTTKGSYNVKVIQVALAQTAVSGIVNADQSSDPLGITGGKFQIAVGEDTADITVSNGASLDDIAESINNAKIGVSASVIKVDGGYRLALLSAETGEDKAASFTDIQGDVLYNLGVLEGEAEGEKTLNVSQIAKNAEVEINGITSITSSSNTITSAIPGLTLNISKEAPDTTVVVKVAENYSDAQKAVQAFVDQYNSAMSFVENKLAYDSDTKIKGDLFGDPILQGIQGRLRGMVAGTMNNPTGPFNILADIGIKTSSDNFGKSAKLEFDTAKFNEALAENPDSVANLLGASSGGVSPLTESTENQSAQGLANIMKEYVRPMVMYQGTLDKTNNNYARQLDNLKDQMESFTDRVAAYAERTRLRFTALETQLAGLSSQSEWLNGQITAMNAFNQNNK